MLVENNLNLPATVNVGDIANGGGFSYQGLIHAVKATGGSTLATDAVRFSDLATVSLPVGAQVYPCSAKVVASPVV